MSRYASPLLAAVGLALLAACSDTTKTSCTGRSTLCGGDCAELASDNLNCGACGHACAQGLLCSAGTCVLECQSGLTACPPVAPTACLDLATDPFSCGVCGHACGAGLACASGTCQLASCGDGVVSPGEVCDAGGTTDTASCNMAVAAGSHRCQIARCGDGYVNAAAGEQCDDSGETAVCNADCTNAICGDGKLNLSAGEQCDLGGLNGVSSCCSVTCHVNAGFSHCP